MTDAVEAFAALHVPGNPLILYNIWDAGSAVAVASAGAKAIATGSFGVARANGYQDGETLPLELVFANLKRILAVVDLPVTIDMEAGYGTSAAEVGVSMGQARDAGAVGVNIEDKDPRTRLLLPVQEFAGRLRAAADTGLFVNARADLFVVTPKGEQGIDTADAVIERSKAYADAGARGLFVPFLSDKALIARICERSPLPVNILVNPGVPGIKELADLGVARISHGHGPWAKAMQDLEADAKVALSAMA